LLQMAVDNPVFAQVSNVLSDFWVESKLNSLKKIGRQILHVNVLKQKGIWL
jgi:hypothetical protein